MQHGLIAAEADQSAGIQWYNSLYEATGAAATAPFTGSANTTTIIAVQGPIATSNAAGLARAYKGGGYTDWYLPSKDELNKLYLSMEAIGGFVYVCYWSSSESDAVNAWAQYFADGYQHLYDKSFANRVRAVQAFEPPAHAGRDGRGGGRSVWIAKADARGDSSLRCPLSTMTYSYEVSAREAGAVRFRSTRLPRAGVAAQ